MASLSTEHVKRICIAFSSGSLLAGKSQVIASGRMRAASSWMVSPVFRRTSDQNFNISPELFNGSDQTDPSYIQ